MRRADSAIKLILASNSPRRRQLLSDLGLSYEIRLREVDESFPAHLVRAEVAEYLAAHKAAAYANDLAPDEVVLTADTIVCLEDDVLNKPADAKEAVAMLNRLQGRAHDVFTGVCLQCGDGRQVVFSDQTTVHFRSLTSAEIDHYVLQYQPFDKAGAYGAAIVAEKKRNTQWAKPGNPGCREPNSHPLVPAAGWGTSRQHGLGTAAGSRPVLVFLVLSAG